MFPISGWWTPALWNSYASWKKKVVTPADLVQKTLKPHGRPGAGAARRVGRAIDRITRAAFERAAEFVRQAKPITESGLQQWMLGEFRANGIITSDPPIAAVQPNNGNPHYEPKREGSNPIRAGDPAAA